MYLLAFSLFAACLPTVWSVDLKALDDFVNLPDPHYKYTFVKRVHSGFFSSISRDKLNMTSQKWLDESEVDKPVWTHELIIIVPLNVTLGDSCFLVLKPYRSDEPTVSVLADEIYYERLGRMSRMIVAVLRPFLEQPLTFYNHPLGHKNITGLDIFAYSWWRFLNDSTAPPHWLVEFPMVKAIVRAMDTVTDYVKKDYYTDIKRFMLLGFSEEARVIWLAAAVDKRVETIVPVAMDFLNFTETFHHQYRAYCGWSYKLRPFYEMNITQELDNPRFSELASHVDPLAYKERYTDIAKFIMVLSGDEVIQPDNSRYYFSQLEGMKYLRIIPNTDDATAPYSKHLSYEFLFYSVIVQKGNGFRKVSWEIEMTNTSAIIYFHAYNFYRIYSYHADIVDGTRRDFRMKIAAGNSTKKNPVKWIQTEMDNVGRNVYKKEMQKPTKGWRGFFIQVIYPKDSFGSTFSVTSEMVVVPDTFPCPDCDGDGCRGSLV